MPVARTRLIALLVTLIVIAAVFIFNSPGTLRDSIPTIPRIPQFIEKTLGTPIPASEDTHETAQIVPELHGAEPDRNHATDGTNVTPTDASRDALRVSSIGPKLEPENWDDIDHSVIPPHYRYNDVENVHRLITSVSTPDQKYFFVDFVSREGYNVNVLPHHTLNDTYILVAQNRDHSVKHSVWWTEISCNAKFMDGVLKCIKEPLILPISATFGEGHQCPDNIRFTTISVGPHDARVFWGPSKPYVIYGSTSDHPCLGQWIQDFRLLVDWGFSTEPWDEFKYGTEMMRPDGWGYMEKNWFVFWDAEGQIYVHHDIHPHRVFAKLERDGTVGPDLAPKAAAAGDGQCMGKYMPRVAEVLEGIHQATNSLSITLCERADPLCIPDDDNTVLFTLFHHKSFYAFHGNYEPFVFAFRQKSPFEAYGIATKPLYIHGRTRPSDPQRPTWLHPQHHAQTEMFYVTSMAWQRQGQRYHGYLDDTLFLSFGIEDQKTAAIDVRAGDLFLDLELCNPS